MAKFSFNFFKKDGSAAFLSVKKDLLVFFLFFMSVVFS